MASTSLRVEGRVDGASNFLSQKVRITLLLEENDLWDIIKNVATPPTRSTGIGNSQQEGSEGQVNDLGWYKG
jgi:hypothetical protein